MPTRVGTLRAVISLTCGAVDDLSSFAKHSIVYATHLMNDVAEEALALCHSFVRL